MYNHFWLDFDRFHKIIWGSFGIGGGSGDEHPSGVIVGGCDNGVMQVYDASKFLKNENPLVLTKNKQTGPVRALDFNPFRVS
jgi:protein transport protein SEC31